MIIVKNPNQPFFHFLPQVLGGGEAPNRDGGRVVSQQVRQEDSGRRLGRLVGRGGGGLLYLVFG